MVLQFRPNAPVIAGDSLYLVVTLMRKELRAFIGAQGV